MSTGNVIELPANLEDLLALLAAKGVSEIKVGTLYVKMEPKEPETPDIPPDLQEHLDRLSKQPTDDELLENPFVGLEDDDT